MVFGEGRKLAGASASLRLQPNPREITHSSSVPPTRKVLPHPYASPGLDYEPLESRVGQWIIITPCDAAELFETSSEDPVETFSTVMVCDFDTTCTITQLIQQ